MALIMWSCTATQQVYLQVYSKSASKVVSVELNLV